MEDKRIMDLYWQQDEAAIRETKRKYSRYLTKIAYGILANAEDRLQKGRPHNGIRAKPLSDTIYTAVHKILPISLKIDLQLQQ